MSLTAFLGLSHLGINYSAAWASFGQPTLALDSDPALVSRLAARDLPIHEPGLPELIAAAGDCLSYSADFSRLRDCDLVVVARDVPTSDDNTSDLSPVDSLIAAATPHLQRGATLAIMSQVPPGFTRALSSRLTPLGVTVAYWV